MNLAGHLASAWLIGPRRQIAVTAGMLLPDAIDKTLLLCGATPYGRTVGHSALFWGALLGAAAIAPSLGPRTIGFLAGGFAHLLIDLTDDVIDGLESSGYAFSAWLGWPVTNPDMYSWVVPHFLPRQSGHTTTLELATIAFSIFMSVRRSMLR